ncbi:MAG: serine protease [Acidimicrobiaceae bacterium]|nr:serine protease [Acidimicrobiaceae bacterium]
MHTGDAVRKTRRGRWLGALLAAVATMAAIPAVQSGAANLPPPPAPTKEVHGHIDTATGPVDTSRAEECAATPTGLQGSAWLVDGVTPGRIFRLTADAGTWQDDFDVAFYGSLAGCRANQPRIVFSNHAGDENSVVPANAGIAVVTLANGRPGAAFAYKEFASTPAVPVKRPDARRPTVIAIIEPLGNDPVGGANSFSPYHVDFLGSKHPWNNDADTLNNIDFNADPSTYVPGYTGGERLDLHLPTLDNEPVLPLAKADGVAWSSMKSSTLDAPHPYWLAGTKVVAALRFGGNMHGRDDNDGHATMASSVAGGNVNGTCPECLFVWIGVASEGLGLQALEWAAKQPWIDVISNSYEMSAAWHDGVYLSDVASSRTKSLVADKGKIVLWAAGNGADGAFIAPQSTYWSSQKGPDWVVTVGALTPRNDQPLRGGHPVDVIAYGEQYPSGGGTLANSRTTFSGSSNATPVTAGTIAHILQLGRDVMGDSASTTRDPQIMASGKAFPCASGVSHCPLEDGKLYRQEVEQILFDNVLPSPARPLPPGTTVAPPSPMLSLPVSAAPTKVDPDTVPLDDIRNLPAVNSYQTEGHGIVYGRLDSSRFAAEQRRLQDGLLGLVGPYVRPPAERTWMTVDSKCRQRLWGTWDMGYYHGQPLNFDPAVDQTAMAWNGWCDRVTQDALADAPANPDLPNAPTTG